MSKSKITDSLVVELVDCTYYLSDWGLMSALSRSAHDHKLVASVLHACMSEKGETSFILSISQVFFRPMRLSCFFMY
jgi:hypothetical protein